MKKTVLTAVTILAATALIAADSPDLQMITRIRQEGFRNSKVMEYASGLTDRIGARLTGSPNMRRANEWTRDELTKIGLTNAHLEEFKFGRGWVSDSTMVRMISPDSQQLYAIAMAWSPATNGPVRGKVVKAKLETKEDLEKNKGKLAGAIVMIADPREMKPLDKPALERYTDEQLEELSQYQVPSAGDAARRMEFQKRREFRRLLAQFAMDEKIAAVIQPGSGDGGVFRVQASGTWREDEAIGVPAIGLAPEHYARIHRLVTDNKTDVELEIDVRTRFLENDPNAWNTIAEIPGTDKKGEVVMMGAHLDSWHTGTGATDNAAGVAVMMEAARIIKALGVAPRRTIRIALWSGEEQGLLGSRAYVEKHFGKRAEPKDPEQAKLPPSARTEKGELMLLPEQAKISAYYNVDNGTGKLRGIWAQENAAAAPIFESWLAPLRDLGATTVTMRNTQSTDHIPFDEVGIPGFQFIQDEVEYETRTHHTNWDTYERLQREDLMQAAVVAATFIWETANRDQMLPRKPLPK
ncbi:MAG TPA: M20/M25/M40 family metallo-hydrolase [Thermoanaerobaculia bacterium]|nr:M20/M25/M40 family metallo-hydrolase [Thermoanaerobaculia bacterium]